MQKRAVVMEPDEKKAISLLQQIQAISRDKESKRKEAKGAKKLERQKKLAKCVSLSPSSPFFLQQGTDYLHSLSGRTPSVASARRRRRLLTLPRRGGRRSRRRRAAGTRRRQSATSSALRSIVCNWPLFSLSSLERCLHRRLWLFNLSPASPRHLGENPPLLSCS
jgi:hypothetical protein